MSKEELIELILDGMLPPIAQQLTMLNPENLDDLQKKANLIEEGYKRAQGAQQSGDFEGAVASVSKHEESLSHRLSSIERSLQQIRFGNNKRHPRVNHGTPCYICGS
jgi:hypothetical protein